MQGVTHKNKTAHMKRVLFILPLLLLGLIARPQVMTGPSGYGIQQKHIAALEFFRPPVLPDTVCNLIVSPTNGTCFGAVMILESDSVMYQNVGFWRAVGKAPDLTAYVKYTDTAAIVGPYLRKGDTIYLSARINAKVNILDTASMLANYMRGLIVADSAGNTEFQVTNLNKLRFDGANDASVSFDALTQTVTISAVPGSGGGGSVFSFNSRTGAVVSEPGDYNTGQVAEAGNLYFTGARVLSTVLSGYAVGTNTPLINTNTVLQAMQNLQGQMNAREPTISAGTTAQYWRGDKTWQTLNKAAVGLGNVDNTSDLAKPISTATQTALNGKEEIIVPGTVAQYRRGDNTWADFTSAARTSVNAGTGLTYTLGVFAIDPAYASFTNYYTKTAADALLAAKEDEVNKSTNLTSPDNIKYPTTLAVTTALAGYQPTTANGSAFNPTLTGALVPATFTSNSSGHVTVFTARTLTPGDIGAVPSAAMPGSWSGYLGTVDARFIGAATGAPAAGTWYGMHVPYDASNSAQLALKTNSFYYRTFDASVAGSWLQVADRPWTTANFAPASSSGSYINNQSAIEQPTSSFWISGGGIADGFAATAGPTGSHYGLNTSANVRRFAVGLTGTESSGNAGSNFNIWRYDDAGTLLGVGMTLTRSTGATTFGGDVTGNRFILTTVQTPTGSSIYAPAANQFAISTNSVERLKIDASGNTVVNSTFSIGSIPAFGSPATNFLVGNGGTVNFRTTAQVLTDIAAAPASGSANYIQNTGTLQGSSNFHISGNGISTGSYQVRKNGSNTFDGGSMLLFNAALNRGANTQLTGDATPGIATWIHNGTTWVNRWQIDFDGSAALTGNLDATGYVQAVTDLRAPIVNSNASAGSIAIIGGATANFRGGQIGLFGGSAGADPGIINFRTGLTGAGAAQPERMRIDAVGGVGIGTTSITSGYKLQVAGLFKVSNTNTHFNVGELNSSTVFMQAFNPTGSVGKDIAFMSLAENMRILTNGNVGIGTAAPGTKLEVNGTITAPILTSPSGSDLTVQASSGQDVILGSTGLVRVVTGDHVDIGSVGAPFGTVLLNVGGNVQSNDAFIASGGGVNSEFGLGTNLAFLRTVTNHPLQFKTNDVERVRILADGKVGVGTTSPTTTLAVNGSVSYKVRTISTAAPYTVADDDHTIFMSGMATGAGTGVLITLPNATNFPGRVLYFHEASSSQWAISVNIVNPSGPALTNMMGVTVIQAMGGQWRLVSRF